MITTNYVHTCSNCGNSWITTTNVISEVLHCKACGYTNGIGITENKNSEYIHGYSLNHNESIK